MSKSSSAKSSSAKIIHLFDSEDDEDTTSPVACNDAFVDAMINAISKGREKVRFGTFVDTTPFVGRTMRGEPILSCYGSPSAMCMETAGPDDGATLK